MSANPEETKQDDQNTQSATKRKWRTFDFIVDKESKSSEKEPGVQRWLQQKELMDKMNNDPNFKSIASHSRLKKEMTEASAQMTMLDWMAQHYDPQLLDTHGDDYVIVDVCSGKGFFGVLVGHILANATVVCMDKNKKINASHFDSCSNVAFHIVDIRAHKFSLSKWIRDEFSKYNKQRLVLFGTHLCGELSQVVIDAFNELADVCCALFLVPCCYPKKGNIVNEAKELGMDTMDYWIESLQKRVLMENDVLLQCVKMNEMLSEKNYLIRVVRTKMYNKHKESEKNKKRIANHNTKTEPPTKKQKASTDI